MNRVAYFDCWGGISGDMALGALLDCGADASVLDAVVEGLGLGAEVGIATRREQRGHVCGLRVAVESGAGPSRSLPDLLRTVARADLPARVRDRTQEALERLGRAEARVHGLAPDRVHLHELGGADTLVDLAGTFWLLESLGVAEAFSSSLPATSGTAGGLPLPAPAALEVLAGTGAVWRPAAGTGETVTPTGAAILATAARFERPAMSVERTGYGLGAREEPGNALRLWLGAGEPEAALIDEVAILETNLDDMAPNHLAALCEDLMSAGALDVAVTPVVMKKGRPGHLLSVIAEPLRAEALARLVLRSSSTLGVRMGRSPRLLAGRRLVEVQTPYGPVRVKIKELGGTPVEARAEYEDCRRLAAAAGAGLAEVMRAAEEAARREAMS
ncbi:MAG: nickel pincer cofactor biosynthesis protein LarC [Candidatus Dormibacterales bacterium]